MQFQPAMLPCCCPRDGAAIAHAQTQSLHGAHCWCARRCYHGPTRPLPNQVALSYRLPMLAPGHPAYRGTTKHHVLRICCRRLNNSCGALSPLPAGYRYRRSAAQEVGTDVAAGRSRLAPCQSCPVAGAAAISSGYPWSYFPVARPWPVRSSMGVRLRAQPTIGAFSAQSARRASAAPVGIARLAVRDCNAVSVRPLKIRLCQSSCRTARHQLAAPVAVA
jgi:hypothetical protein